jgi:AcrR family transcriptional regulator
MPAPGEAGAIGDCVPRTATTSSGSTTPKAATRVEEEPGGPRSRKGARTRARLLAAAKQVFERDGFLDARISDIAEAAAISHGAFYHYFDSKEQIFREVAEAQESFLTAPPTGEQPADGVDRSPRGRIRTANRRYLERYRDQARIMGVIEQVSRFDDHVKAARAGRQKHFAERAERAIRRWQAEGLVDSEVDPAIAATALGAMVARFAELWLVQGYARYRFDEAVEQLTRLWANALGLDDRPEPAPPRRRRARAR